MENKGEKFGRKGCIREGEEGNLIVEEDLNIRKGELRGMEIEGKGERCSKDKIIASRGRSFVGKR